MRMIRPQVVAPQVTIAEEQEEFLPITAALVRNPTYAAPHLSGCNTVLLAFRPSDEERARLAAGDDLYISLLTFLQHPMPGIVVTAGKEEVSTMYAVPLETTDDKEEGTK